MPREVRWKMDIQQSDELEFFVCGDQIILCKPETSCMICKSKKGLITYKDKMICAKCAEGIAAEAERCRG